MTKMTDEELAKATKGLGEKLARFADDGYAKLRAGGFEDAPERCASCAFKAGTFPNTKAPETALDALKCLIEHHPFGCHHDKDEHGQPTRLCAGYLVITATQVGPAGRPGKAPWPFSDEREATDDVG